MKDTTNIKDLPANSIQGDVNCCGNSKRQTCLTKARNLFKNIRGGRSINFLSEDMQSAIFEMVKEVGYELIVNPKQPYFKADILDKLDEHYKVIRFGKSEAGMLKTIVTTCIMIVLGQAIVIMILVTLIKK